MNNKTPIYTITCMTNLEVDHLGWPNFGATAFMGFYHNLDDAWNSVLYNNCDITEHIYHFAVIEEIEPGIYSYPRKRWFFEYNLKYDRFYRIQEPSFMHHIANVL